MYATQGHFPFWLAIWGAVLLMQALGLVPAAWTLLRSAGRRRPRAAGRRPARRRARRRCPAAGAAPSSAVAQEAARVRALIEQRGGSGRARLLAEVDGILKLTADLAARQADLEEQTSERERAALAAAVAEARARLDRADLDAGPPPLRAPARGRCRGARRPSPRRCACSSGCACAARWPSTS